jgi:hypothetical protein
VPFAVRLATLLITFCGMWFAIAILVVAIENLQPTHPKAFAIVDQRLPPESTFGVVVAVILTYQFYLRAAPNISGSARTGALIIGGRLGRAWCVVAIRSEHGPRDVSPRCLDAPICGDGNGMDGGGELLLRHFLDDRRTPAPIGRG